MEHQNRSLRRVQRSAEHIGDMLEEINWAFADMFDIAAKGIMRIIKSHRSR